MYVTEAQGFTTDVMNNTWKSYRKNTVFLMVAIHLIYTSFSTYILKQHLGKFALNDRSLCPRRSPSLNQKELRRLRLVLF